MIHSWFCLILFTGYFFQIAVPDIQSNTFIVSVIYKPDKTRFNPLSGSSFKEMPQVFSGRYRYTLLWQYFILYGKGVREISINFFLETNGL